MSCRVLKNLISRRKSLSKKIQGATKSKQQVCCDLTDTTVLCRHRTKASAVEEEEVTYFEYIFTPAFSGCQGAFIEFK